jgi:hypothetical protein
MIVQPKHWGLPPFAPILPASSSTHEFFTENYLRLENINHNSDSTISSTETGEIRIADIEIMSETKFWAWVIPIIVTVTFGLITWLKLIN